jgi:uncharacterized protein YndB with AHSA1/START domain
MMKVRTVLVLQQLALLASQTFAFSVVFTIATLAGLPIPSAMMAGAAAAIALAVASIIMKLVPATIIHEDRLTIRAPREAVYAAIADPRPAPRRTPAVVAVDDLMGEPGAAGTRWRATYANGAVFASEVVAAEPPARLVICSHDLARSPRRRTVFETEGTLIATPAGTELTIHVAVQTVLWNRLVERLRSSQAAPLRRWLNERFREELEAGAENREVALRS